MVHKNDKLSRKLIAHPKRTEPTQKNATNTARGITPHEHTGIKAAMMPLPIILSGVLKSFTKKFFFCCHSIIK